MVWVFVCCGMGLVLIWKLDGSDCGIWVFSWWIVFDLLRGGLWSGIGGHCVKDWILGAPKDSPFEPCLRREFAVTIHPSGLYSINSLSTHNNHWTKGFNWFEAGEPVQLIWLWNACRFSARCPCHSSPKQQFFSYRISWENDGIIVRVLCLEIFLLVKVIFGLCWTSFQPISAPRESASKRHYILFSSHV